MTLVKILKRKDASSVIVAILVAMTIYQPLSMVLGRPVGLILGLEDGQYMSYSYPGGDWKTNYLHPVLTALVQLLVLEVLAFLYVTFVAAIKKK